MIKYKITPSLLVAVFAFIVGAFVANLGLISNAPRDKQVISTRASWSGEAEFIKFLEEHKDRVNLPNLRTLVLPEDDLEVRLWYDASPGQIDGFVLRRTMGKWSAVYVHGTSEHPPLRMKEKVLLPPRSGWELAWEKLERAGILTLPDASLVQCRSASLDGVGYVVETNVRRSYRTYRYGNPQLMKCNEAASVLKISEIVEEEFDLWNPRYRE